MGSHTCLAVVTARNKFWARWRINRLLKWIENKGNHQIYNGFINEEEGGVVPFDKKTFDEFLEQQTDTFMSYLEELHESTPTILKIHSLNEEKYENKNDPNIEKSLNKFIVALLNVQISVPTFTHKIFYDVKIDVIGHLKEIKSEFLKKDAERFWKHRAKGWITYTGHHQYDYPEDWGNYMAVISIRD